MVSAVFIVRHGIRIDIDDKRYFKHYLKRPADIPLSPRGIIQAQETGDFLLRENITHIFSSPFFRTLQTAYAIAEKLDLFINVENGFIEMLNPDWFSTYPDLLDIDEAISVFPRINKEYKSIVNPVYPETDYEGVVLQRTKKALDEILAQYDGAILIVGHGASTESAAKALMHPQPLKNFAGEMCAINKYAMEDMRWKFEYGSMAHLSEASILN